MTKNREPFSKATAPDGIDPITLYSNLMKPLNLQGTDHGPQPGCLHQDAKSFLKSLQAPHRGVLNLGIVSEISAESLEHINMLHSGVTPTVHKSNREANHTLGLSSREEFPVLLRRRRRGGGRVGGPAIR